MIKQVNIITGKQKNYKQVEEYNRLLQGYGHLKKQRVI
jgi:hypothetical protein